MVSFFGFGFELNWCFAFVDWGYGCLFRKHWFFGSLDSWFVLCILLWFTLLNSRYQYSQRGKDKMKEGMKDKESSIGISYLRTRRYSSQPHSREREHNPEP